MAIEFQDADDESMKSDRELRARPVDDAWELSAVDVFGLRFKEFFWRGGAVSIRGSIGQDGKCLMWPALGVGTS